MGHRVIIVVGGAAGGTLAFALRAEGFLGSIALICDEPVAPYSRALLGKQILTDQMDGSEAQLRPTADYTDLGLYLCLGQLVSDIRLSQSEVSTTNGVVMSYDSLVLATGARPRLLSSTTGANVFTLRSLADTLRVWKMLVKPPPAPSPRYLISSWPSS